MSPSCNCRGGPDCCIFRHLSPPRTLDSAWIERRALELAEEIVKAERRIEAKPKVYR